MFGKRLTLFKLLGFSVRIDLSWVIIAVLITWSLAVGLFPDRYENLPKSTYWLMGLVGALGLFISIIFHELSHSLVARRYGLVMKGITLFSNANGTALSDECFWPIYEKADELNVVFFIHPTYPLGVEAMKDYMLMPLVGFPADTTLAAASLIFGGVCERFPKIKWVLGHLGGAVLYLAERLDRGFEAYDRCRKNISRLPSEYLKKFYYDTVNFDINALQFAIDFVGGEHLLAGSDYPHLIGNIPKMLTSIEQLEISDEQKAGMLGENAARLFGL